MKLSTFVTISSVILPLGALVAGQTIRYIEKENQLLDVDYQGEVIRDLRYVRQRGISMICTFLRIQALRRPPI